MMDNQFRELCDKDSYLKRLLMVDDMDHWFPSCYRRQDRWGYFNRKKKITHFILGNKGTSSELWSHSKYCILNLIIIASYILDKMSHQNAQL